MPATGAARVLVVDDNADSVAMLTMLLEMKGHVTAMAQSGPEAVAKAETFRPGVVVLDIGLPGMDGYEVAGRLRQRFGGQGMTLVALTGWGSDEDRQRTREAGFQHHFTKPVDPEALQRVLEEIRT